MFVGREKELNILNEEVNKQSSSILIYGKRKIGKTTLINKCCLNRSDKPCIYFECLKDTEEKNVKEILKIIKSIGLISEWVSLQENTFLDLFKYLNSLNKPLIVVIDEYPYLKEFTSSKTIDSIFQNIIDNYITNINLIISGSHIGMMKDLLKERNALFGRFSRKISLGELSYLEASQFYPNLSSYDKVSFYSVFGGSPYVNEKLVPNQSLMWNIVNLLMNVDNPVYIYASSLLISDFSNQVQANRILSTIGNGKKSYSELEEVLDRNKTGLLSKYLKPLLEMELIKKDAPINRLNDAKKAKYEINDNLLRFYYTYIQPNQYLYLYKDIHMIYEEEIKPSIITFISLRFEDICKAFMWRYVNDNNITGITNIGRYYYDDSVNKTNGEFDLAILHKNKKIDLIEVKYLSDKLKQETINKELSQINKINEINVDQIGFISINGFDDNVPDYPYKFDGNDIYKD